MMLSAVLKVYTMHIYYIYEILSLPCLLYHIGFLVISIVAVSVMYMGFIALLITCHRNKNMNKVYPQQSTLATQSPQNPARWNTSNATNNGSRLSSTSRPTLSPTEMCVVIQHLLALHIQDIGNLSTYIQP